MKSPSYKGPHPNITLNLSTAPLPHVTSSAVAAASAATSLAGCARRVAGDTGGVGGIGGAYGGGGIGGGLGARGRGRHTSTALFLEYFDVSSSFVQLNQSVILPWGIRLMGEGSGFRGENLRFLGIGD